MANEYLQIEEFKQTRELRGETFLEEDITLAITAASRVVESKCGRRFWADANANQVRHYTPSTADLVIVDDVVTLTSLLIDRDGDGTFEETWTENTDFTLEPLNNPSETPARPRWLVRAHPLSTHGAFPTAYPRTVKVAAKFGWPAVPDEIKQAAGLLASRLLVRARDAPFAVVQLGLEGVAGRIASDDPDVRALIARFIRQGAAMGML